MAFEHYIQSGGKTLRLGYTTGTCAALAAQGAVYRLLAGSFPKKLSLCTPKGIAVEVIPEECSCQNGCAACGVRKDGGDDIDKTSGTLIFARACFAEKNTDTGKVMIDGGKGVGRVTKPGLDQPPGAAAINTVPRKMIREAVEAICRTFDCRRDIEILIEVPEGEEIAQKTFNPNLGIVGGISILGTSGIVEPMSMQALIDTISVELRQARAMGYETVILTPGNYGLDYLKEHHLYPDGTPIIKCSNFIGDALDECRANGFRTVLLVGHVGKLVKLAGGIMNTHSRFADCRTELFCAYAAVCGAGAAVCRELLDCASSDACLEILDREKLREPVMKHILDAVEFHLTRRAEGDFEIGAILFSNQSGELGRTKTAGLILEQWKKG